MCAVTHIEALAIYIINKSIDMVKDKNDEKYYCDIYKLHKLLYYAQGIFLARYDVPLFQEEIEAWDCGPMVDGLIRIKKKVGYGPITKYVRAGIQPVVIPPISEILDYVVECYGGLTRVEIVNLSRDEQTWKDYRKYSCSAYPNPVMGTYLIKENFVDSMRNSNDKRYSKYLSIINR